jgi:serine/threonine protein kinase
MEEPDDEKTFRERVEEVREQREDDSSNKKSFVERIRSQKDREPGDKKSFTEHVDEITSGNASDDGRDNRPYSPSKKDSSTPSGSKSTKSARDQRPPKIPSVPDLSINYDNLTLGEPIGGGGNADVITAEYPIPDGDMILAVKEPRISGTLHADQAKRMIDEAETWDKLDDHDHIVSVLDYGDAPLPWIAMEYMDGGHLGQQESICIEQALWTAISITRGVRHAHRRGVAHLDIKPENVLFTTVEDAWAVPKVADWGLSKHLLHHSNSMEGVSPQYAAPEQFDESYGETNLSTDIYQLGATLYKLFTGDPPFKGSPTKVMRAVMDDAPTPPSQITDVPKSLDNVLLTAMAKQKEDRYDDIVYLRDDLQDIFDNLSKETTTSSVNTTAVSASNSTLPESKQAIPSTDSLYANQGQESSRGDTSESARVETGELIVELIGFEFLDSANMMYVFVELQNKTDKNWSQFSINAFSVSCVDGYSYSVQSGGSFSNIPSGWYCPHADIHSGSKARMIVPFETQEQIKPENIFINTYLVSIGSHIEAEMNVSEEARKVLKGSPDSVSTDELHINLH